MCPLRPASFLQSGRSAEPNFYEVEFYEADVGDLILVPSSVIAAINSAPTSQTVLKGIALIEIRRSLRTLVPCQRIICVCSLFRWGIQASVRAAAHKFSIEVASFSAPKQHQS